ncbi:DUF3291 domain-containing protein [Aquimarina sp. ERC-38]|nr:DUF3291 domain-containing protein [Aquimarina sp. ERC-38]
MMQFMHTHLKNSSGQEFYKLLGSGKQGFNPLPDWEVYGLLQVWENEAKATDFFLNSKAMHRYRSHADHIWTLYLKNIKAKGEWDGQQPFKENMDIPEKTLPIAVITRATIKIKKLRSFWKYVPTSQSYLENNPDLLFTKGVGEVPFTQMATFSIWKNEEALKQFAYRHKNHRDAIKMTHQQQWYKEELFSRFQLYKFEGDWGGEEVLKEFLMDG